MMIKLFVHASPLGSVFKRLEWILACGIIVWRGNMKKNAFFAKLPVIDRGGGGMKCYARH